MGYAASSLFATTLFGIILISGLWLASMATIAYGQSSNNLNVKVDKALYESADTITASGKSTLSPASQNLEIQVINPHGAIYRKDTITPSASGDFQYQVKIGGKFAVSGLYTVSVRSTNGQEAKTTFDFVPEGMAAAQFMIDGKSYNVRIIADQKPEWLQEISPDPQASSLVFHLSNAENEDLKMEFDHNVLAADPGKCLIVEADGEPVDATCSQVDSDTTLITMTVPGHTSELRMTGSFLVPEFGTLVVPFVIIAFTVSIFATRLRQ